MNNAPNNPFAPIAASIKPPKKAVKAKLEFMCILPVPQGASPAPDKHPTLGKPSGKWQYKDANSATLGYACRFDLSDGAKQFRPLALFQPTKGGKAEWRWEALPEPRPLYGLDHLAARPQAIVMLCEGEKACDAARRLLPDYVAITSSNGSKSAAKANWTPLKGRDVIIWRDNDEAGQEYATHAAKLMLKAGVASIKIITPPCNASQGWDAADAEIEGWQEADLMKLVTQAKAFEPEVAPAQESDAESNTDTDKKTRRPPRRDGLIKLTESCKFWHYGDKAYATFKVESTPEIASHYENWAIRSQRFKSWLSYADYKANGTVAGGQAIEDALRILESKACEESPKTEPWLRNGSRNGKLYIDLCDDTWRAIEITKNDWRVLENHDLPFIRTAGMDCLPTPEGGYDIENFRAFCNVASEGGFHLLVSWLLMALTPYKPYPILFLGGEQGTGKSNITRYLRELSDPNRAGLRILPKDIRDLIVSASNSHVLAFDNVSRIEHWLSDTFCSLATGAGSSYRTLHTDNEESIFYGARPIILNGIPTLTDNADLGSRALTVRLKPIPDNERKTERKMNAEWDVAKPRILGALLTALSSGLRIRDTIILDDIGRMADFIEWVTACEAGLGWETGTMQTAYNDNRKNVTESSFEANVVAMAIVDLLTHHKIHGFSGTATELLAALDLIVPENTKRLKLYPKTAQGLGNQFDRISPLLRDKGFTIERKHSGVRTISILPKEV
jgi:putative DNA primase/helicase